MSDLAKLPLPPPTKANPGIPGQQKAYGEVRDLYHYDYISSKVSELAQPKISSIVQLRNWQEKQDAVDELFESLEVQLKEKEEILGLHPKFGHWVETALEEFLRNYQKPKQKEAEAAAATEEASDGSKTPEKEEGLSISLDDVDAHPIFMDCYNPDDDNAEETVVPEILHPLKPHPQDGPGRMVEEWEMSAHNTSKRILLRQCTRAIAQTLENNDSSRIYVHGRKGVGKVW